MVCVSVCVCVCVPHACAWGEKLIKIAINVGISHKGYDMIYIFFPECSN